MVNESFLALACAGLIGILFGLVVCFAGYRLFLVLLPIWGFIFGLAFGAQTMQALFGVGFLATVTSWVVGFIVGGVFAVLSYLFYMLAVAIIAGSLGYSIGVGLLLAIGMQMNFIVWLVGIVVAVVLVVVTFRFNLAEVGHHHRHRHPRRGADHRLHRADVLPACRRPGEPGEGCDERLAVGGHPGHRRGRPGHPGAGQAEPQLHDRFLRPLERAGLISA